MAISECSARSRSTRVGDRAIGAVRTRQEIAGPARILAGATVADRECPDVRLETDRMTRRVRGRPASRRRDPVSTIVPQRSAPARIARRMGSVRRETSTMFRIKASEVQAQIPKTAAIVLVMLVLAFALSVAAVLQVFAEYRLLGDWRRGRGRCRRPRSAPCGGTSAPGSSSGRPPRPSCCSARWRCSGSSSASSPSCGC